MDKADAPRVDEIEVVNLPNDHDMTMRIEASGAAHTVTMDGAQAAALITALTARLMERQSPEALIVVPTIDGQDGCQVSRMLGCHV